MRAIIELDEYQIANIQKALESVEEHEKTPTSGSDGMSGMWSRVAINTLKRQLRIAMTQFEGELIDGLLIELNDGENSISADVYYSAEYDSGDRSVGLAAGWDVEIMHIVWREVDICDQLTMAELDHVKDTVIIEAEKEAQLRKERYDEERAEAIWHSRQGL